MPATHSKMANVSWINPRHVAKPADSRITPITTASITVIERSPMIRLTRLREFTTFPRSALSLSGLAHKPHKIPHVGDRLKCELQALRLAARRHQGPLETELRRFFQPRLRLSRGPYVARQRDLAKNHAILRQWPFGKGRDQCRRRAQSRRGLGNLEAAGDVQIDIVARYAKPCPRIEHGENHRQTAGGPTDHRPARAAIGGRCDKSLHFGQKRPRALDSGKDGGSGRQSRAIA